MATATTEPVRLPPGPGAPKILQGIGFVVARRRVVAALSRRYGRAFTVNLPIFGQTVVFSDPILLRELFSTSSDLIERPTNLGELIGPGSTFSLNGDEHRERRKLLVPPFHGKRMRGYEQIIEEEVLRETSDWPEGREFKTAESMLRIALNTILRAVFGAEGHTLAELQRLLPPAVKLGGRVLVLPSALRRDLGSWSPWGRFIRYRRQIDEVIFSLIADARADPAFEERSDVLALMLQARYDDGQPISDRHIADELMTLVTAGHETTAAAMAWTVERLSRHPQLLSRLTDEVDAGGSELRQATIWEVLRTRQVLAATMRTVRKRIQLGDWVLPEGAGVILSIELAHELEESFPDATSFNPDRFLSTNPKPLTWIPFGGGVNRCIGAAFANVEMDVILRTLLREFRFVPTDAPDEPRHDRGVAVAPKRGGRAVVYRRTPAASSHADSASVADRLSS